MFKRAWNSSKMHVTWENSSQMNKSGTEFCEMHTSSCESFQHKIPLYSIWICQNHDQHHSDGWHNPKTNIVFAKKTLVFATQKSVLHTYAHAEHWACRKVSFEWILSIFWCCSIWCVASHLIETHLRDGSGKMVNQCYGHNRWLNAFHSKNKFSE